MKGLITRVTDAMTNGLTLKEKHSHPTKTPSTFYSLLVNFFRKSVFI